MSHLQHLSESPYFPRQPPLGAELDEVVQWFYEELKRLSSASQTLHVTEQNSPPAHPIGGAIYLADGTDWNPGSGRGMYWYDDDTTTYKFLG